MAHTDALLRAESAIADREAWASINELDTEDCATDADPVASMRALAEERSERHLRAQLAAHVSWANTPDPAERTRKARESFLARFEREVDPDGTLDPAERARRAEHARKAYFLRLSLKSAQARRKRGGG